MATHEKIEQIIIEIKLTQKAGRQIDGKIFQQLLEIRQECRTMEFKIIKEYLPKTIK